MMALRMICRQSTRQEESGDFVAVLDQASAALLRQRGRMTYRTLQRQFQLMTTPCTISPRNSSMPIPRSATMRGAAWSGW